MTHGPEVVEIDMAEVEALLARTKERMTPRDHETWQRFVETHLVLRRLVHQRGTTIARLRRLFGLPSSEKMTNIFGEGPGAPTGTAREPAGLSGTPHEAGGASDGGGEPERPTNGDAAAADKAGAEGETSTKPKSHGRIPVEGYPEACQIEVLHEFLRPGQTCPLCGHGTLFALREPARILRIVGQPFLVGRCYNCQRLRCSGCGEVFTARAPAEAQGPKHAETAAAMIALLRYGGGMPHYRLEHLQRHLRTPVPASTQWDVVNECVVGPEAAFRELCRLAAQGKVLHNDDTYMRILAFMGKRRAELLRRGALPDVDRTGLYTTAIVAMIEGGQSIALFFTGRRHAGENLNELLRQRADGLLPPVLMCDALDRNLPADHEVVLSNCACHARRNVVDEVTNFPSECRHVLEMLGKVFKVDEQCRTLRLSDEERLCLHQRESGPVMDSLKTWMQERFEKKLIEPNSGLGDAFNYMLKRWDKLTLFLRLPGAPLHNNVAERTLKKAIRHRRNSLFYRNARGAYVGDVYMTLIHTTELHGGNAFHYLTELMRHEKAVVEDPAAWLPWNYRETLARLGGEAPRSKEEPPRPPAPQPLTPRQVSGAKSRGSERSAPPPAPT